MAFATSLEIIAALTRHILSGVRVSVPSHAALFTVEILPQPRKDMYTLIELVKECVRFSFKHDSVQLLQADLYGHLRQ